MNKNKRSNVPSGIFNNIGSQSDFIKDVQELTISELIELYAYAEAIVETVREPLIILDKDFRIKSVNKGFLKTFQTTLPDSIGKYFFDLGDGQWNIPSLRHLLEEVLPKKCNFDDFEVDHIFPDIGQKIMLINARCVVLSKYRTQLILVAIEDVTDRVLIERRTEKFISMASHELRTPLTSIKAFMQLLEKKLRGGMDKPTESIMSHVIEQLNNLNALIQDLFDVRKIKEGTLVVERKIQKIEPIVKEAVSISQIITDTHKISIKGKTNEKVLADKERIIQVIINLLNNAIKYSPNNKNIQVRLNTDKNNIIVSVHDFGPGIRKSDQKHIFEAYFTSNKRSGKDGLGLGLYICSEIIALHMGKIWLESRLNKGSIFYFSIPIKNPA